VVVKHQTVQRHPQHLSKPDNCIQRGLCRSGFVAPDLVNDKEKEQKRLEQAQLIGEIGNQVGDIARTEGDIAALNASRAELAKHNIYEPDATDSAARKSDYQQRFTATESYKAAQQQWGTGSAVQQGIQAATAAVQGLAAGNMQAIQAARHRIGRRSSIIGPPMRRATLTSKST